MSWFKFSNLSVIVNCVTKSLIRKIALNLNRWLCSHCHYCSHCSHCSNCSHCRIWLLVVSYRPTMSVIELSWTAKKLWSHARSIPWYCSKVWRLGFYKNETIVSCLVLFNIKSQKTLLMHYPLNLLPIPGKYSGNWATYWYKMNHFGEGQSHPVAQLPLVSSKVWAY